jgi:hypothetical protein
MKRIFLVFVFALFLISFASAEVQSLGTFKVNSEINIEITCDGVCTSMNITSITDPDSIRIVGKFPMTKSGTVFNFTLGAGNTTKIGEYTVKYEGDLDGNIRASPFNFFITSFGTQVSNSGVIYSVLMLIVFGLDILVFILIFFLGRENHRNDDGDFIGISLQKYGRAVLIGVSYGLILITLNLMNAAANTTSEITQFAGIIGGIYLAMLSVAWVWTISIMIWIGIMVWKDANLIKFIQEQMDFLSDQFPTN